MQTANTRGRPAVARLITIFAMAMALGAGFAAGAADTTATLKERLSDKASDNQRVDNCRVPVERRGSKPRADCKLPARVKTVPRTGTPGGKQRLNSNQVP
jgi:hypothetical protein